MKKIVFLLSIYILLLNFQPLFSVSNNLSKSDTICCEKDNYSKSDNNHKSKNNTENRLCNPFLNCFCCHGFNITVFSLNLRFIDFEIVSKTTYLEKLKSKYFTDYFIPPKLYFV